MSSLKVLSASNSFNTGADLWIAPDFTESRFAPRLDWYMNFQISHSLNHQKAQLSSRLDSILKQTQLLHLDFIEDVQSGTLFSTENVLPNRWVLILPKSQPLNTWCERISNKWEGLRRPSLRVFLPKDVAAATFEKAWSRVQSFDDLSLVLD